MDKEKSIRKMLDNVSKRNMELDGCADYRRGLRTERERIIGLIEQDIGFQSSKITHDFEKDKAILWRVEGMKFLIGKIKP